MCSVRKPLQVNRGKSTPGIDHVVVTTPEERGVLCEEGQRTQTSPAMIADQHDKARQAGDDDRPDEAGSGFAGAASSMFVIQAEKSWTRHTRSRQVAE
jgi:hypothetical protein